MVAEQFGVDLDGVRAFLAAKEERRRARIDARFSEISDIDIAVEGLAGPAEFFTALGIAMEGTGVPVDVVEREKVPPDIAERIRERGALVHERSDP